MKKLHLTILFGLVSISSLIGRDFTVMVYNVENLFDLDGISIYDDYQSPPYGPYSSRHLLNKLEGIRRVLAGVPYEGGADIVLFQEFESDRSPYGTPDARAFIEQYRDTDLATLLETDRFMRKLPAELLLLKYLEDNGITGYRIAAPSPDPKEGPTAVKNVVFSRFPIQYVRQFAKHQARDLLEVGLEIDGELLIVLNNHWKSGASNPEMEAIRVQNARVVRARLDAILLENPLADVIIGGDLNSHYNHKAVFPDLPETGVNDVLRSTGDEGSLLSESARGVYNLWFEVPAEERGSEVWRGRWGTLMQMLITPGLYDQRGIQYIDNTFNRLILPGENVDTRWSRPRRWTQYGEGGGFSDHLPIYARFRVVAEPTDGWMELDNPTNETLSADMPVVPFDRINRMAIPPASFLEQMSLAERALQLGELFEINTRIHSLEPLQVRFGDLVLGVFAPDPSVRARLNRLRPNDRIRGIADLGTFRGELQLVFHHASWLTEPAE